MWLILTLTIVTGFPDAIPQGTQDDGPGWVFRTVIPNPTGENGYEEFILASEMIAANREYQRLWEAEGATLADERKALSANRKALALFRQGLKKQAFQPRTEIGYDTLLPEFARFRDLGRMLAVEQEVALADGRITDAINTFRDAVQFSQRIQQSFLIAGLVGLAVEASNLVPLSKHLEMLSYTDCNQLLSTVEELVQWPAPLPTLVATEKQVALKTLDPETFKLDDLEMIVPLTPGSRERTVFDTLRLNPELWDQELRNAREHLTQHYDQVLVELQKPYWERNLPEMDSAEAGTIGEQLACMFAPAMGGVDQQYARSKARMRLLATHTAILRYRWWYDKAPSNLDVLELGDLVTDPFTGKPFPYKPMGYQYRLYSTGRDGLDGGGVAGRDEGTDIFLLDDGSR